MTDTVVFAGYSMLTQVWQNLNYNFGASGSNGMDDIAINCQYSSNSGTYEFSMANWALYNSDLAADGFFGNNWQSGSYNSIPFSEDWSFDENGIILLLAQCVETRIQWLLRRIREPHSCFDKQELRPSGCNDSQ